MPFLSPSELTKALSKRLTDAGVSTENANSVARALCQAQLDGQGGHGVSRIASYAAQAVSGKVNGQATPTILNRQGGLIRIDAQNGFAYPALDLAIETLTDSSNEYGIMAVGITRSHHFGVAGWTVERLAKLGLIGIICGNAPAAMAPWGGSEALFGTNPLAFACPRRNSDPLVIDLSLSEVARGKVMLAQKEGRAIPDTWGKDKAGNPTTDPNDIIDGGTMTPMGGVKGASLALMVEILSSALVGANFSSDATSFFHAEGAPPNVGQLIIAINPKAMGDLGFTERVEILLHNMQSQAGVRLPGTRRLNNRKAKKIEISDVLFNDLLGTA